ncbi:hypothetical protein CLOM_g3747, partial [Closterium sp. NIES-68]
LYIFFLIYYVILSQYSFSPY